MKSNLQNSSKLTSQLTPTNFKIGKNKNTMNTEKLNNGDHCLVIGGVHKGKSGIVQDLKTSKTGHITITVLQKNGIRLKTLGKNVIVQSDNLPTK